ncbi:MAG: hypothetical protein U9Q83_04905, partial [Bacteroidota bacterium]|nr:hypothetical protein [Bacteroidota bacterium]
NVPKINTKIDTVFIEKAVPKTGNKNVEILKKQLNFKNDTIFMLKKQLNNVPKIITKIDTVFIENTADVIIDTTLIVAYYTSGKTIPDSNIVGKIINMLQNNKVQKIEISGFTDNSGGSYINKKITDTRINYIKSKISPFIAINKIYYQNFGDALASKNIVPEERRVEIKIYNNVKE